MTTINSQDTKSYILTPKPPATPRINGPRIFGVRPVRLSFSPSLPPASAPCASPPTTSPRA